MKSEVFQHFAPPETSNCERPVVEILGHPSALECELEQRCAHGASQMKAPFAPIQATECKPPPRISSLVDVHFQVAKRSGSCRRDVVRVIPGRTSGEPSQCYESVVKGYSDAAGDVVAAGFTANDPEGEEDFTVVKLCGVTGVEVWRQVIADGSAEAVVVDTAGDVLAAGVTRQTNNVTNFPAAASRLKRNATDWDFGTATADWGTNMPGVGFYDASTAGNLKAVGVFSTPVTVLNTVGEIQGDIGSGRQQLSHSN